jgi:hypothetical protein
MTVLVWPSIGAVALMVAFSNCKSLPVAAADESDREWRGSNRERLVELPPPIQQSPVAAAMPEDVPRIWSVLASIGGRAVTARELGVDLDDVIGQGTTLGAAWRWPQARPRLGATLALPAPAPLVGTITIDAFGEAQSYQVVGVTGPRIVRADRQRLLIDFGRWLSAHTWIDGGAGFDRFSSSDFLATYAAVEEHFRGDRIVATTAVGLWSQSTTAGFWTADATLSWQSSLNVREPLWFGLVGNSWASASAPLALWMGAGTGSGRPALLRAHPLLEEDVVAGPSFGRRLGFGTIEYQRPLKEIRDATIGYAIFVDSARAWQGLEGMRTPLEVDAGVGMRIHLPHHGGLVRVDFARGLRDGQLALSAGWAPNAWAIFTRGVGR